MMMMLMVVMMMMVMIMMKVMMVMTFSWLCHKQLQERKLITVIIIVRLL